MEKKVEEATPKVKKPKTTKAKATKAKSSKKEPTEKVKAALEMVAKAMKDLEDVNPSTKDVFEDLGVLVGDVADMVYAVDKKQFIKEKSDCRKTAKAVLRKVTSANYMLFTKENA